MRIGTFGRAQPGIRGWCANAGKNLLTLLTVLTMMQPIASVVADESKNFSQEQLDQMMAPVALYPDALLSQVLMASTYSEQVKEAAAWSKGNPEQKGDDAVKAVQDKDWDPSVASLVAFPQALVMMGDKPDWVKQMGDAFLAEPDKVMDTVQGLRKKAKDAGNLENNDQQKVVVDSSSSQTVIVIEPSNPEVIYVPTYNPTVVYGTWWWPAYPPFYYPPPPGYGFGAAIVGGIGFGIGIAITNSIWGGFDWHHHDVNINVNRYNNININNRIDVNKTNVSWKHNESNRKGTRDADRANRPGKDQKLPGADQRQDYRGRDADREKAMKTLQDKGIDPAAERKQLSGSAGDKVRDQVGQADRQRDTDRGGRMGDRAVADTRAGAQRDAARPATASRRDNALSGVNDGAKTRMSADRGARSNMSFGGGGRTGGARAGGGGRAGRGGRR